MKEKRRVTNRKSIGLVEEEQDSGDTSVQEDQKDKSQSKQEVVCLVELAQEPRDEFHRMVNVTVSGNQQFSGTARIDTGCPNSIIKTGCVDYKLMEKAGREWNQYSGINKSKLRILGIIEVL